MEVSIKQLLTLAAIFITIQKSQAKEYKINEQIINIHTPENWQVAPQFFGSEYTFFGPYKEKRRPIISLNKTPLENYKFNQRELINKQSEYQKGRKQWLEENKGELLNFFPYKKDSWSNINEVHSIGYSYEALGEKFEERNYFFQCKENVLNISTLMTFKQKSENQKIIAKILNSIKCD